MKKSYMTAAVLSLVMAAGIPVMASVPAEENHTVSYQGEIAGYNEKGLPDRMKTDGGEIISLHMPERGGRLLARTPFTVTGEWEQGDKGPVLKVDGVSYADVDPYGEYAAAKEKKPASHEASVKESMERDPAFFLGPAVSNDKSYYINDRAGRKDDGAYEKRNARELDALPEGALVSVEGRAISTVKVDAVMTFWDEKNEPFTVVMNGAYAPLGQRSALYGTVHHQEGKTYLSLDKLVSIA